LSSFFPFTIYPQAADPPVAVTFYNTPYIGVVGQGISFHFILGGFHELPTDFDYNITYGDGQWTYYQLDGYAYPEYEQSISHVYDTYGNFSVTFNVTANSNSDTTVYIFALVMSPTPTMNISRDFTQGETDHFGEWNFSAIQDAINETRDGGYLYVYAGEYHEHLTVNKSVTLRGENSSNTTLHGDGQGSVVTIDALAINISHFTIMASGTHTDDAGVNNNQGFDFCTIDRTIMKENHHGISLSWCDSSIITNNLIFNNSGCGIVINNSTYSRVYYNQIVNNSKGIFFNGGSTSTDIFNNLFSMNTYGVYLFPQCDSQNNRFSLNNFQENTVNAFDGADGGNTWYY